MAWFDETMDTIMSRGKSNQLGGVGEIFGANGIGGMLENWTNPVTQTSGRNPLYSLATGRGNLYGSYEPQGGTEETINRVNGAAGLLYAGYAAGGAMGIGGEGTASGGGGAAETGAYGAGIGTGSEIGAGAGGTTSAGAVGGGAGAASGAETSSASSMWNLQNLQRSLRIMQGINSLTGRR